MEPYEKRILAFGILDSSNDFAERLLKERAVPEGTIIWAKEQIAGKGQGENRWISEPDMNLTFSMILYPRFLQVDQQFFLNMAVSLGIMDFLASMVPEKVFSIKWPNDIYYEKLKLGGILINNTISGSTFDTAVIGIGININQVHFDPSIPNPTSVKSILSRETKLEDALVTLIEKIDQRYEQLKSKHFKALADSYRINLLGIDQQRNFFSENEIFRGIIRDVDTYGQIIIETPDKSRLVFAHKEVEYVF